VEQIKLYVQKNIVEAMTTLVNLCETPSILNLLLAHLSHEDVSHFRTVNRACREGFRHVFTNKMTPFTVWDFMLHDDENNENNKNSRKIVFAVAETFFKLYQIFLEKSSATPINPINPIPTKIHRVILISEARSDLHGRFLVSVKYSFTDTKCTFEIKNLYGHASSKQHVINAEMSFSETLKPVSVTFTKEDWMIWPIQLLHFTQVRNDANKSIFTAASLIDAFKLCAFFCSSPERGFHTHFETGVSCYIEPDFKDTTTPTKNEKTLIHMLLSLVQNKKIVPYTFDHREIIANPEYFQYIVRNCQNSFNSELMRETMRHTYDQALKSYKPKEKAKEEIDQQKQKLTTEADILLLQNTISVCAYKLFVAHYNFKKMREVVTAHMWRNELKLYLRIITRFTFTEFLSCLTAIENNATLYDNILLELAKGTDHSGKITIDKIQAKKQTIQDIHDSLKSEFEELFEAHTPKEPKNVFEKILIEISECVQKSTLLLSEAGEIEILQHNRKLIEADRAIQAVKLNIENLKTTLSAKNLAGFKIARDVFQTQIQNISSLNTLTTLRKKSIVDAFDAKMIQKYKFNPLSAHMDMDAVIIYKESHASILEDFTDTYDTMVAISKDA